MPPLHSPGAATGSEFGNGVVGGRLFCRRRENAHVAGGFGDHVLDAQTDVLLLAVGGGGCRFKCELARLQAGRPQGEKLAERSALAREWLRAHSGFSGGPPVAITMRDRFLVRAPIDDVWEFMMDPRRVVLCMPGAQLEQIESDRAYLASVKVAIGPFTTSYKGRVEFAEVDESLHRARLTAEGRERGGGAAYGSMVSSLRTVEEGTEVVVDVSVEGASRIVHLGLGLTENLAQELFGQFVTCVKERLEAPPGATSSGGTPAGAAPVQVLPLLAKAFLRRFRAKGG